MDEPCLYRINLDANLPGPLGIQVETAEGALGLEVVAVTGGQAAAWNEANPSAQVRERDCILEVNGVAGDCAAMLAELQDRQSDQLQVLLVRPPSLKLMAPEFRDSGSEIDDSAIHNCSSHCQPGTLQPLFCQHMEGDGL